MGDNKKEIWNGAGALKLRRAHGVVRERDPNELHKGATHQTS